MCGDELIPIPDIHSFGEQDDIHQAAGTWPFYGRTREKAQL